MKKQIMTALAVSAMMTLAMPFASFAASRSCQTGFRPGNTCGSTGNVIDLYTLLGKGCANGVSGNNCGTGCAIGSRGDSCSSGANCGSNSCTGGSCSTNNCGSGNCLTYGNVSMIPGAACGSFVSVR